MRKRNGSILIPALWLLIILSFLAISVGIRTQLEARMMSIQRGSDEQKEMLESAVQIARFLIESDNDTDEDSPHDSWYGTHDLSPWLESQGYELTITDEENKININRAPPVVLKTLFEVLAQNGAILENSPQDLAASIARWRGENPIFGSPSTYRQKDQPFESLEELLLVEKMTDHDFEVISPFLTVYGKQGEQNLRINLNTVSDPVMEALILSLAGDEFSKKELSAAFASFRRKQLDGSAGYWGLKDMSTDRILVHLNVSSTVLMVSLVNQLLQLVSVDSSYFSVTARRKDAHYRPASVSAVLGPTGGRAVPFMPNQMTVSGPMFFRTDNLDTLSWKEGV